MKIGRNDPCPCGSGRKYKRCCLEKQMPTLQPLTGIAQRVEVQHGDMFESGTDIAVYIAAKNLGFPEGTSEKIRDTAAACSGKSSVLFLSKIALTTFPPTLGRC
jgi:hypothetical protein